MALSFVGTTHSINQGTSGNLQVPYPSVSAGDVLVMMMVNNWPAAFPTPTGWTQQVGNASVNSDGSMYVFTKIATGSETGSASSNYGHTGVAVGIMAQLSGADPGSELGDFSSAISGSTGTSSPTSAGTLTPAPGATDMVVRFYGWAEATSSSANPTLSTPSNGWTTQDNQASTSTGDFDVACLCATQVGASTTAGITASRAGAWMVADMVVQAAPDNQLLIGESRIYLPYLAQ